MQLILEAESTVDLKTKMSLSEDNVDKSASDIVTGVQNGDISNGDAVTEKNETAKVIENTDVEKLDQIKESEQTDTNIVLEVNGETMVSNNIDDDTSNDCNATAISNGISSSNKDSNENIDSPVNSHIENDSIEKENTTVEESCTKNNSDLNETEANCDVSANAENKETENKINATEPVVTACSNIETETITPETNSGEDIIDNSNICQIENNKEEITDTTESVPDESTDANINATVNVDINQEHVESSIPNESTDANINAVNEDINQEHVDSSICEDNPDSCGDHLIKEGIEEISHENNSEVNPISNQTTNESTLAEVNDSDMKISMSKTENVPVPEAKQIMESETTEMDTSDENVDLIRLDSSVDNDDKIADSVIHEKEKEDLSAIDLEEKESLKTGEETSMDVDTNICPSDADKSCIDFLVPVNTNEIIEENGETTSSIKNDVSQLAKNSRDLIVNLDDNKVRNTEPVCVETESALSKKDDEQPILSQNDLTGVSENVEQSPIAKQMSEDIIIDLDEPKDKEESKAQNDNTKTTANEDPKPIEPVLKLSNTLDILSDDEEEQALKTSNTDTTDSKCINIEDDDDIMLIDDDISGNESTAEPIKEQEVEELKESKPSSPGESVKQTEEIMSVEKLEDDVEKDAPVPDKEVTTSSAPDISEKIEENKFETEIKKPLIPENFLKTCKKNLVDMTRDELEEFCILKIVESILDRSNLSEIKNKLKMLTQNLEEYKKKAMMLQKQNRDLQVVFKSVQEDVKKATEAPIVPLKITRSVGMQVLMSDKPDKRRRTGISVPNTFPNNKPLRNPVAQGPRPQKPPTQPIPVPRLVPANNPATKSPQQQVNTSKVTSPLPNGVKSVSPVQKGEKRTHNRMQSVTVDLTDDEPPTKMVNRTGPMPPVRLVPSQNLLAAPRTPGANTVNSPRKVYIPISGPQGQNVRPGQTIMLKTVPNPGPRQRTAPPHMVRMPQSMRMTRPQGLRHPAPLPECMKQYQPPNWKALPPAPDLKLAKVENGIVISWKIEGYQEDSYEEIASYQLYAYQETTSPPNTALWKKIGDVKALPLPMACTLTQFMAGYKYYFAVRAVDIRSRLGPFSLPGSILLLNKM